MKWSKRVREMSDPRPVPISDEVATPTFLERVHRYSIDSPTAHSRRYETSGQDVEIQGEWNERRFRGTATRYLVSTEFGAKVRVPFQGTAASIILPMDFESPSPYGDIGGALRCRIDGKGYRDIDLSRGREVLIACNLDRGGHELEVECLSDGRTASGIEAIRGWDLEPATVRGKIDGGALLTDVRANVLGPVQFSRSIRSGRTGAFSLLLPVPGEYRIDLQALGWDPHRLTVKVARGGQQIDLPSFQMRAVPPQPVSSRTVRPDESFILVCFAHSNIWGQESAEWLERRIPWINAQAPHVVLDSNEVNPQYVAGALSELQCPWLTCTGNHSMTAFEAAVPEAMRNLMIGPARVITVGKDASWDSILAQFKETDHLRIACSYEPFAPPELLARHRVKLLFYGHSLEQGCHWERDGTTYLRKVDANTFYRVEIDPPHDFSAPIRVQRFVANREI